MNTKLANLPSPSKGTLETFSYFHMQLNCFYSVSKALQVSWELDTGAIVGLLSGFLAGCISTPYQAGRVKCEIHLVKSVKVCVAETD